MLQVDFLTLCIVFFEFVDRERGWGGGGFYWDFHLLADLAEGLGMLTIPTVGRKLSAVRVLVGGNNVR